LRQILRGVDGPGRKTCKRKSIFELAQELTQLTEKARNRTIDLADLKGGTFTITNYGAVRGPTGLQSSIILKWPFWASEEYRTGQ